MWAWRKRSDEDFSEEIRANMALDEDRFIAEGMSPEEARAAALRAFGNVTRAQERFYESRRTIWLDDLQRDVRYALRGLIKNPGFTVVAVATLALGIGANAAIFSVVNSLLLRSLPVTEPQRLVTISSNYAVSRGFNAGLGWNSAMWDQLRQRANAFDGAFAWTTNRFDLAQSGEIQPVDGIYASGESFTTLGVPALLGRTFTSADDVRGGGPDGPVAVISYGLWQRRFGGAANIIGSPLLVGRVPFTIWRGPAPDAPEGARGFVGIAFRLQPDNETYDAFYLRPTNGRADDQERRNRSVQYISHPEWPWFRLRKETPAKYEAYVDLVPGAWTKVKIDVRGSQGRLFVHDNEQPTLIVNDVKTGAQGKGVNLVLERT